MHEGIKKRAERRRRKSERAKVTKAINLDRELERPAGAAGPAQAQARRRGKQTEGRQAQRMRMEGGSEEGGGQKKWQARYGLKTNKLIYCNIAVGCVALRCVGYASR